MTLQSALSWSVEAALAAALLGTLVRGHFRACLSFPVYLAVVLAGDMLIVAFRAQLFHPWFWILKQCVWDLAKFAVAIEILARAMLRYPGAKVVANVYLVVLLVASTLLLLFLPDRYPHPYGAFLADWQPRVLTATIWLMTGTALLVAWYRLPLDAFARSILVGFVPYLVVFVTLLSLMRRHDFSMMPLLNRLDRWAYLAVCVWWAANAWRSEPGREASSEGIAAREALAC